MIASLFLDPFVPLDPLPQYRRAPFEAIKKWLNEQAKKKTEIQAQTSSKPSSQQVTLFYQIQLGSTVS